MKSTNNLPDKNWGIRTTGVKDSRMILDALEKLFGESSHHGNLSEGGAYFVKEDKHIFCESKHSIERDYKHIQVFTWEEFQARLNQPKDQIITNYDIY